jgi:hypothetical protein
LAYIKKYALNYHEHRYEMSIMLDALLSMILLKQKEGESLQDYTNGFKTSRDVLRSHIGGPFILSKYFEEMAEYKANPNDSKVLEKCQEKVFQQLLAFTYLENSDRTKYGSLLTGLQTQQSLKK